MQVKPDQEKIKASGISNPKHQMHHPKHQTHYCFFDGQLLNNYCTCFLCIELNQACNSKYI